MSEERDYPPYKPQPLTGPREEQVWDEHGRGRLQRHYDETHGIPPGLSGPAVKALCWEIVQRMGHGINFPEQFERMLYHAIQELMPVVVEKEVDRLVDQRFEPVRKAYAELLRRVEAMERKAAGSRPPVRVQVPEPALSRT